MASVYQRGVVVLLMCCVIKTLAIKNLTIQRGNDTAPPVYVKAVKKMSNSTNCTHPKIDQSKIEEVLHLQHEPTRNVVKIKVSVVSGNETRYFHFTWASEIGRTIISLVWYAEKTIFSSLMYTGMLKVGTAEVDMKLNVTDLCLPPGNNGTKEIFDIILRELFSHSKDTHFFKLCRVHNDGSIPFNCCRIIGSENLTICADYSSVAVKIAFPAVILIFCVSSYFFLPFLLEYIVRYPSNDEPRFYKTSESHMSLTSVFSMIFFEGRGPVKSLFRRSVFAGLSLIVFLPVNFFGSFCLTVAFWVWFALFVVTYDVQMTNDKCKEECNKLCECNNKKGCSRMQWGKDIISCFTLPFFLPFDCLKVNSKQCKFPLCKSPNCCKNLCCKESCCKDLCWLWYGFRCCLLIILYYPIIYLLLVLVCLVKFTVINLIISFVSPHPCPRSCSCKACPRSCSCKACPRSCSCKACPRSCSCKACPRYCKACSCRCKACLVEKYLLIPLRFATIVNVIFVTGMILMIALFIVVGLTLNAEYFSPFVAPMLSLVLYFWLNWKFSVEGRCLQLKTSIIEICKEKATSTENTPESIGSAESEPDNCDLFCDFLFCLWPSCCGENLNEKATVAATEGASSNKSSSVCCCFLWKKSDEMEINMLERGQVANDKKNTNDNLCKKEYLGIAITVPCNLGQEEHQKQLIQFDNLGEAMIPKRLYDDISKVILPLDHLVIFFFRRLIFVMVYSFALFIAMILARDSGIPESVQVISAIAGVLIPFIFDTIFAEHHFTQRNANNMAIKEKLGHILRAKRLEYNTIEVKLINQITMEIKLKSQNENSQPGSNHETSKGHKFQTAAIVHVPKQ